VGHFATWSAHNLSDAPVTRLLVVVGRYKNDETPGPKAEGIEENAEGV
jgi:hypothetical protein